jgi:hypothetical protein
VTDYDPIMVGCGMRRHMYFVASEHVYRHGFVSRLLRWAFAPIARVKGATDASAAMKILRALRGGASVCVFAEGERTWNGRTGKLHPSTARLARSAGVDVATYKLTGGYMTSPRWSASLRRGKVRGELVCVYSPARIGDMTNGELLDALERDLFTDAFADQRASPVKYAGGALAERLETAICACPQCGSIGAMMSEGDEFGCACGFRVRLGPLGFFEGESVPFSTVAEWDEWQESAMREYAAGTDGALFTDPDAVLRSIGPRHERVEAARGEISIDGESLTIGGFRAPLERIGGMTMHGRGTIIFSYGGTSYEIIREGGGNLRKYVTAREIINERRAETAREG